MTKDENYWASNHEINILVAPPPFPEGVLGAR